jgi:Putative peptidoglycan binding domain/YMGG-like Gly-zipper
MYYKACALAGVALMVTACGSTPGERATTGSGIGAAAGAVIGAVTGLSVVEGVLIGAGAGGVTGALTNNNQINLGKPIWQWGSGSNASTAEAGTASKSHVSMSKSRSSVKRIQLALGKLGYEPGPIDGKMGKRTAAAIRQYQEKNKLLIDGHASPELAQRIEADANRA